jgi:phosphoribosylformylglycinamidine cyclo-ligase
MPKSAYAAAGVDIAKGDAVKAELPALLAAARRPEVLGQVGGFGGLFRFPKNRYKDPVLVSSVDGVGTKLKLAFKTGRHDVVGEDIVNHCIDDIAVLGAEPLFFLDYIGMGVLDPKAFRKLIAGMARACASAGCALIGGETAQMPGMYQKGEYDVAGCIVGVVERARMLSGEAIRPGDAIVGVASSGLHTNGYSLAQKLLFEKLGLKLSSKVGFGSKESLADALLKPHLNYGPLIHKLQSSLNKGPSGSKRKGNSLFGVAHITGGGFTGNIPRILPKDVTAVIDTSAWERPAIFQRLATDTGVSFEELHEVFNMGVGLCLIVSAESVSTVLRSCVALGHRAWAVGFCEPGSGDVRLA